MNLMIMIGLLSALGCIFYGVPELQTSLSVYLDPRAFVLVAGGSLSCTIMASKFKDFLALLSILSGWMYMKQKKLENYDAVKTLVKISEESSRRGKSAVLEMGKGVGDGYLHRALGLMGAGLEREFVRNALETDIAEERRRHLKHISMIRAMGSFAPMFGMMGTVMGVMLVLQNISDINSIVSGMALALLTTLYGLLMSSIFFIPITAKLKNLNDDGALTKEIIKEGVLAIMDDQIPLKVEKLLMAYLSSSVKNKDAKKNG